MASDVGVVNIVDVATRAARNGFAGTLTMVFGMD